MAILNLDKGDPFSSDFQKSEGEDGHVHIRIQQRNGRKTLTTVQGIPDKYDFKKIVKVCKKEFACNGTVVDHPEYGEVIQLQGDQRNNICDFLIKVGLVRKDQLKYSPALLHTYYHTMAERIPEPEQFVHICLQQRAGHKVYTTIQGLPNEFNLKLILRFFKKKFACNGTVEEIPEHGAVVQLEGDQRIKARDFLLTRGFIEQDQIIVHDIM